MLRFVLAATLTVPALIAEIRALREENAARPMRCEWGLVCATIEPHRHWLGRCTGCGHQMDIAIYEGPLHPSAPAHDTVNSLLRLTNGTCPGCLGHEHPHDPEQA